MEGEHWLDAYRLHFAAQDGNVELLRQLLSEGEDVNAFDEIAKTPLHYAAKGEHFEAVELLLAHGANVNAIDESKCGDTPLADVAQTCSLRMAQLLLKAGANPTIPGNMWLTALHRAEKRKRGEGPAVYQMLLKAVRR